MKTLFAIFLVANLLTETMAALTLIAGPDGLAAAGTGGQWSMHYGFAALAIAAASLWVWPQRNVLVAVTPVLGILLTFHAGLLLSLTVAGDQQAGVMLHALLFVLSAALFATRKRWCGT